MTYNSYMNDTKLTIANALLNLLKTQPLNKITVTQITKESNLTRQTFYRIFEDKEISQKERQLILEACMQAPSAGNQQMYTIIDVQDKKLQETLSKTCDNQSFINQAKMVLIFCADFQKWYDLFSYENCNPRKPGVGDLLLATTDATIAAQNAVVAAESLGIGSCYIGDILEQHDLHRELLNLSEYVVPVCMLVLGYPAEDHFKRQKPKRCKLEDIVCVDQYHRKD